MKKTLIFGFLCLSMSVFGQRAQLLNDTVYYQSAKFYVNQVINLSYGSNQDKSFAFVRFGSGMSGVTPAHSSLSKSEVLIDKVYKTGSKYYFRGKIINGSPTFGMKLFVDIEGAIDNKELTH